MKDTLLYDRVPLLAATRYYEYNPGVTNRSGEIFANALSGAASDFADAIKKREELQKTDAYNDMVMQHAYEKGQVSEEEMNKYMSASHSAKTGIAAGHAANIVADWKQQSAQTDMAYKQAETKRALAQAAAEGNGGFSPGVQTINPPGEKPFQVWSRGPKQWEITPGSQGAHPMAGQTIYHPESGEPIGMYDVNGNPKYFPKQPKGDPMKEAIAAQITGASQSPTPTPSQTPASGGAPTAGTIIRGYKFKGGNPADPNSWEKVQ